MNEEQGEELIDVLKDIKELLEPRQKIIEVERPVRPEIVTHLMNFKAFVTSDSFFKTLTQEQKDRLFNLK